MMERAPHILEIGEHPLFSKSYPETTRHWSTQPDPEIATRNGGELVTLRSLGRLARELASDDYDLVVVQPAAFPFWQWQAISRSLFRRSAMRGSIPYFRTFGQELIRGRVRAPIAIWDMADAPIIPRQHLFLLDRAALYFKRELPVDHWRVFMGTVHHRVPTPRFRNVSRHRERIAKLRPISLGLPLALDPSAIGLEAGPKRTDVFFAGRVDGSATIRKSGLQELLALRDKGYSIDVPDGPLPWNEYLKRCGQAWLTWAPEGYGYETFRSFEAAVCNSVPVLNYPSIHRYKPLREGIHCFYHDADAGSLTRTVETALRDRDRLAVMAHDARQFVVAEHSFAALGRYVAETVLAHARGADAVSPAA